MWTSLPSLLLRYGGAVVAVALAVWVRLLLDPQLGDHQLFGTFFVAVTLTAYLGGLGPALLAIVLGVLAADYYLLPPRGTIDFEHPEFFIDVILFAFVGVLTAVLSQALRVAHQRAEAEARALREQREWLAVTLSSIADGVITTDTAGCITFINPVAQALTGWSSQEAVGLPLRTVFRLLSEHDRKPVEGAFTRVNQKGLAVGYNLLVARNGREIPVADSVAAIRNERGSAGGVVLVFRDITERKRSEQTFRFLANASAALAALGDTERTLERVAQQAMPFFTDWCVVDMVEDDGSLRRAVMAHGEQKQVESAQALAQRDPNNAPAPICAGRVLRTREAVLLTEVTEAALREAARDEDQFRALREFGLRSCLAVPIKVRGQIVAVLSFATAESGRRFGPPDLLVAEDLANRASIALENALLYREAREADRRKDEFLAMLAHELRNPLAPLRNGLELLRSPGAEKEAARRAGELMHRQLQHLVRLVDDLLDVSRIMRGKIQLRKETTDLAAVVSRAVETALPLLDAQGHELTVALPDQPLHLSGDVVRLTQIVANLLTNAAKYTDRAGRVWLTAQRQGDEVVIRVRDTGIGIAADILPRIFEPFTQSDRAMTRAQGGLGIGLSLALRLAELHGGTVAGHSEGLGQGSEFVVRLPALPAGGAVEASPATPVEVPAPPSSSRRVLVVDDNVDGAESLAMILKVWGHTVRLSHDGPAALEEARRFQPEVVLMDIGLPGMSGLEVARQLRQQPEFAQTLLVAMTGYSQEADRRRSKTAGFDHHFVKPVELESLQVIVAGALP